MTGTEGPGRPTLDELGPAFAEPARLRILLELLGGVPLPAGALAARVGLAPSTVSAHLARLVGAGLVTSEQQGRRRLLRLAGPEVAEAVESLARLSGQAPATGLTAHQRSAALREARSCYDHLAGRLGVALSGLLLARGWLVERDGHWLVPDDGLDDCAAELGLPLVLPPGSARPMARACSDWTERRPHLAGLLGAAILTAMLDAGWLSRHARDRSLRVTPVGRPELDRLGLP